MRETATATIQAMIIGRCLRLMKELKESNREPDKKSRALFNSDSFFLGIYTRLMSRARKYQAQDISRELGHCDLRFQKKRNLQR